MYRCCHGRGFVVAIDPETGDDVWKYDVGPVSSNSPSTGSTNIGNRLLTTQLTSHSHMTPAFRLFSAICSTLLAACPVTGAETLQLESPVPYQVSQRIGVAPGEGYAHVVVRGELLADVTATAWEYRIVNASEPSPTDEDWRGMDVQLEGTAFESKVLAAAGGWYRLEIRCFMDDEVLATGSVEPIGVGEVFVVAGQSYATNANDEQLQVADPRARVVAFDSSNNSWRVANDPQPAPDGSDGGSIWPPLGDALAADLDVPIGFANVAVGGTSSMQWMPDGDLHPRLIQAGQALGRFRAVLWQQGESDVIAGTSTEQYVANMSAIREAAVSAWECDSPWLLAKSTHHPTVYNDAEGEGRIRSAIDQLATQPGFRIGPDTDSLQGENRGGPDSRRHFTGVGQRRAAEMWRAAIRQTVLPETDSSSSLLIGVAETDITPPVGFPMAGYYHERLAEGTIDPLKAKAIVFRDGETAAALVVCDLIGIATDLSREVRRLASERTGIPESHIVLAATHSHTAPDYMKELYLYLGNEPQEELRAEYIRSLIAGPVDAIARAYETATPASLENGAAIQTTPVSFNRRFVMQDGSVQTWQSYSNPEVVRAAGPIDPEIGLLAIRDSDDGDLRAVVSSFALHLDTVGGTEWSADYPFFIERTLRKAGGENVISLFGTGCCGDINHVDPSSPDRNKAAFIGESLGNSINAALADLAPIEDARLSVGSRTVQLPLQEASRQEVERAVEIVALARSGGNVEFLDHVTAYKHLILDQMLHAEPYVTTAEHITWGLSRSLAGIGETLPVDVTVMTIGHDVAIVCLPGEVFVELGLAIKQASPYRTTIVIELSNAVETIYVPHRAAYAGGSYEVTNSNLQPGGGEMLVEAAISLLRAAATSSPEN